MFLGNSGVVSDKWAAVPPQKNFKGITVFTTFAIVAGVTLGLVGSGLSILHPAAPRKTSDSGDIAVALVTQKDGEIALPSCGALCSTEKSSTNATSNEARQ
eukprot:gnl/TRDRNA2_/TRDRNA2_31151_c0_seq1.p2 gnl/TRDRNA2_/TRDRNA2_31151_c0~~gnl/TRDRNA2_/TRDRNA2_31151_c0_seq1.p2  ORF type:complete len:101 (+),score=14.64 gnl/TRDRNA2_/TRDRNA2_31151_c0_seq1:58-360(+)